jgi:hypothetical protein
MMKNRQLKFKKTAMFFLVATVFISCGKNKDKTVIKSETTTISGFSFKESEMKTVDLSTISDYVNVIMKIPKSAKVIKNGNGNIDILLNKNYIITVDSSVFISDFGLKELVENKKSLFLKENFSTVKGIITREEPNGFVYITQIKTEENGTKYEPEHHFSYSFANEKEMYTVYDIRPLDNFSMPGSTYTEANANALYNWVKASVKIK